MKYPRIIISAAIIFFSPFVVIASDRSDATDLMNKCDISSKIVEIPIRNFGDKNDIASFENGLNIIKQGKVKLAQSKYLEAKAKFEEYQKAEYDLYGSLSPKYMQRAQELIDTIAEDLVDFVSIPEVLKNFNDAAVNLDTAKLRYSSKQYPAVIQSSRIAKNLVLNCYALSKKDIPAEYKKDLEDIGNKIFQE
jgi:hypothetical protein